MTLHKRLSLCALAALLASAAAPRVYAAATPDYPVRPIRLIVPFSAGGSIDILARLMGQRLTAVLGQTVVVDNRAGAGGIIGVEAVARANPDGHTLLMGHIGTQAIHPALYSKLPYDPLRDFAAITLLSTAPNLLLVHPSLPVKSVQELIALSKAQPRRLNYGSGGVGGSTHMSAELFMMLAGVQWVHVPYKGGAPALAALLGAEVPILFNNVVTAAPHVKAGRVRALAVTSQQRSRVVPELPSIAEAGVSGYHYVSWYGLLGPAAMPPSVIAKLNAEVRQIMNAEAVVSQLAADGAEVATGTPGEFAAYIKRESARWAEVIKKAGIRAD